MTKARFAIYDCYPFAVYDIHSVESINKKPIAETVYIDHEDKRDKHIFEYLCQFHPFGKVWVVKIVDEKIEWVRKREYRNKEFVSECDPIFIPPVNTFDGSA